MKYPTVIFKIKNKIIMYEIVNTNLVTKFLDKNKVLKVLAKKPIIEKIKGTKKLQPYERELPAATQEDLAYLYEELGWHELVRKVDDAKKNSDKTVVLTEPDTQTQTDGRKK